MIARSEEEFEQFMVRLVSCQFLDTLKFFESDSNRTVFCFVFHFSVWI